jgi:hypothetical protein
MRVGGDDPGQTGVTDQRQQGVRLVGSVDERLLAGERAAQEVRVVGHRADRDLGDDEIARFARVGRPADLDLA